MRSATHECCPQELVAELLRLCMDSHGCRLLPAVLAHCTIPELTEVRRDSVYLRAKDYLPLFQPGPRSTKYQN